MKNLVLSIAQMPHFILMQPNRICVRLNEFIHRHLINRLRTLHPHLFAINKYSLVFCAAPSLCRPLGSGEFSLSRQEVLFVAKLHQNFASIVVSPKS